MNWNKNTEKLAHDYTTGKISSIKNELDKLLIPFDYHNPTKTEDDWKRITDLEKLMNEYKDIALSTDEIKDNKIIKEAINDTITISRRLKSKKEFAHETLEEAIIEQYESLNKTIEEKDISKVKEAKKELHSLKRIASIIDYKEFSEKTQGLANVYEKKLERLLEEEKNNKEKRIIYEQLISQAEQKLHKTKNTTELEETKNELALFADDPSLTEKERKKVVAQVDKYKKKIFDNEYSRKKRSEQLFSTLLKTGLIAGGLYIGFLGVKATKQPIEDKITQYKETQIVKKGGKEAEKTLHLYKSQINQKKQELATIEDKLEHTEKEIQHQKSIIEQEKQEAIKEIEAKKQQAYQQPRVQQAAITPTRTKRKKSNQEKVLNHYASRLAPVLNDKQYTLYIEKNSNLTLLFDRHGKALYATQHTDARDPKEKKYSGQNRTPEGVFEVDRTHINTNGYKDDLYGVGFIRVAYPNAEQVMQGYTGSGILLCSAANHHIEQAISTGKDVMNCGVAYKDEDFTHLFTYLNSGSAQIIIEDHKHRPLDKLQEVDL